MSSPPSPTVSFKLTSRLFAFFLSLALSLLALEVGLRALDLRPLEIKKKKLVPIRPILHHKDPPLFTMRPSISTNQVYFRCRSGTCSPDMRIPFRTNKMGWRDEEVSRSKPDGTFRILVLGDSFTAGDGVQQEQTYPEVLEDLLNERYQGTARFEAINTAVQGTGTYDQWHVLQEQGLQFSPDMVLVGMYLNDTQTVGVQHLGAPGANNVLPNVHYPQSLYLAKWIRSFRYSRNSYRDSIDMYQALWDSEQNTQGLSEWSTAMSYFGALQQDRNLPVLIALFPWLNMLDDSYPFGDIHERIGLTAQSSGMEIIDLLPVFSSL
ncbi:MAG: hypothetical protein QGG40_12140, partial [Myxococcota bacterium]|nr:hypothetical protein [Myxococcota bacterium]